MKNHLKSVLKVVIVCALFIISGCEKDLYEENIKQSHNSKPETLTGKEAEKVALRLKTFLGSHNLNSDVFSKTITLDIGTISYEEILKIIDSYGKENYTFEIIMPEESDKKFANLILQEKDGYTTVKIIEFEMTNEFAQLYKDNPSMAEFKGIIKVLPVYSDAPCPDTELIVQIGNVPPNCTGCGGGSNNNGNDQEIPGGIATSPGGHAWSVSLIFYVVYDNGLDNGGGGTATHVHSGNEPHAKIVIDPIIPTDPTAPVDPCPPATEIGILEPVNICAKLFLEHLSQEDKQYVYNHGEDRDDIMQYFRDNKDCDEANQMANEILKELKRGCKIDFVNKIIIDSSFVNNQKAMCVYNKMRNINAFNKALAPFEETTPVAFLKLTTEDMGDNGRAVTEPPTDNLNIITIKINNNFISHDGITYQPNLLLAQTIIHEVIHADLFRKIMIAISIGSYVADPDVVRNALSSSEFDVLSEYFRQGHDWPHSYMADHMRNTIARITEEFATGLPVENPSNYYKLLAWRGLMHYGTVSSWTQIVGPNPNSPEPTAVDIDQTIYNYETTHANENCQQ